MRHIYTGLDIGSNTIKMVVCELYNNKLNLLAQTSTPSIGIKRGLITDTEAAKNSIKKAIDEIESMLGFPIRKVAVTIPSYLADCVIVKGSTTITNEKSIITGEDVDRVLKEAIKSKVPEDMEIVTDLPIDFKVDDKNGIKDPKGLLASRLSVRTVLVTVPKKNLYSVAFVLEALGVEIVDVSLGPINDMATFKTKNMENRVTSIINIGYETTNVSLYNKGILVKTSILPLGSENIDKDLSYIYKITKKDAQIIKENFAFAHKRNASVNDFYEVTNTLEEKVKVGQFEASEIVMARLEEILTLSRKEITNLTSNPIDYIIITGGTSNMYDFEYIANDVFGKKAILGNVKMLGIRNNIYSVALGSVIHFINRLKQIGKIYTMIDENDEESLDGKDGTLLHLSSDSMLGKVFSYFFSE